MPEEFPDYASLIGRLRALIDGRSSRIIGIEGYMAAGKSHLAKRLAADLNAKSIEVDDCSYKLLCPDADHDHLDGQPYLNCLDLNVLSVGLAEACDAHPVVIIEGICLRDVLGQERRRNRLHQVHRSRVQAMAP
jgi:uridine kinase